MYELDSSRSISSIKLGRFSLLVFGSTACERLSGQTIKRSSEGVQQVCRKAAARGEGRWRMRGCLVAGTYLQPLVRSRAIACDGSKDAQDAGCTGQDALRRMCS